MSEMPASPPTPPRRRRPRAVSFVASLLLFESLLVILVGLVVGADRVATLPVLDSVTDGLFGPLVYILPGLGLAAVIVVAGGGLALAGVGLLALREWAWVLAMALQGLGLVYALRGYLWGEHQFIALGLGSFVVLVLNQREVRQAFVLQHEHP